MFDNGSCLGVDLSGNDIKVVELKKRRGGFEVVQSARIPAGGDVSVALKAFLLDTGTDPSRVVWSLPTGLCSVKFAELPKSRPSEIARMARYEAETQIPLPLSDLVWDFSVNGSGDGVAYVVIAGAKRSVVEEHISSLNQTGLPLASATPSALAVVRGLSETLASDGPALAVDIGAEWTDICVVSENGRLSSCRSVNMGTESLVRAAASLGENARDLLLEKGIPHGGAAAQKWIESLALEIRRSVVTFGGSSSAKTPVKAVLTGDGALFPGICGALAEITSLSVSVGDPWMGMTLSAVAEHSVRNMPAEFAAATGLAMAGLVKGDYINLMPDGDAVEIGRRRRETIASVVLAAAAVILFAALMLGHTALRAKSDELADIRAQADKTGGKAVSVRSGLSATVSTMKEALDGAGDDKHSAGSVLIILSRDLPRSCWLTDFRFESGKTLVLKGKALSNSSVADALYALQSSGNFDSVSLDYSNLGTGSESSTYDFQMKCALPQDTLAAWGSKDKKKAKSGMVIK